MVSDLGGRLRLLRGEAVAAHEPRSLAAGMAAGAMSTPAGVTGAVKPPRSVGAQLGSRRGGVVTRSRFVPTAAAGCSVQGWG